MIDIAVDPQRYNLCATGDLGITVLASSEKTGLLHAPGATWKNYCGACIQRAVDLDASVKDNLRALC
jgi:fructose-1,6-bisphosphatase/sedoheptulose 1,7-bisphosphatase-like protein